MSINTQTNRTLTLFVTIAVLWGTSFMVIEAGLDTLPPMLFVALRYDVTGVVLFGYGLLAAEDWRLRGRDEWLVVFVGGALSIGAHFSLLFSGQRYVTSGVPAIVISLTSVPMPLFAWPMFPEERLDALGFLGALLGLAGTVVIAPVPGSVDSQLFGVLLLFLAAVVRASGSVFVKRLPGSPLVVSVQSWMMSIGVTILYVTSPVLGEPGLASVARAPVVAVALLFLAILCNAVGFIAYFALLDRTGTVEISLVNYVTPVVAAITGWAFLSERLGPVITAGLALVLAGFAFMKRDAFGPPGWRLGVRVGLIAPAPTADPDGLPADDRVAPVAALAPHYAPVVPRATARTITRSGRKKAPSRPAPVSVSVVGCRP